MPSTTIKLDFKRMQQQVRTALKYFEFLNSDAFAQANKGRFQLAVRSPAQDAAIQAVDQIVYSYIPKTPEPYYVRSYRLRRSIKAAADDTGGATTGEIVIYSDPAIAPGKAGYGSEDMSYAAFFIKPREFSTFLRPRGSVSPNTYRNFFIQWERFMAAFAPKKAMQAIEETISRRMPTSLRRK